MDYAIAALVIAVIVIGLIQMNKRTKTRSPPRVEIKVPAGWTKEQIERALILAPEEVGLAPDGTVVFYGGSEEGLKRLYGK